MPSVSNLTIKPQSGTTGTYYASWTFNEETKNNGSSGSFKAGDLVSIKSGATYYNGVAIPSWVMNQKWYLTSVKSDRAVLGKNESGSNDICSPIKTSNITKSGGSGSSSSSVAKNTTDHYTVRWLYDTGNGVWFDGGSSDVTFKNATYSPPSNAIRIRVSVLPVSKTYKVNDKETSYWTGSSVAVTYGISASTPEKTSAPTVEIEKYTLTASLENISDAKTDYVKFEIYNGTKLYKSGTVKVVTRQAKYKCAINAGGEYRVRARSINEYNSSKIYGEWSDYSSVVSSIPSIPEKITSIKATSKTSIRIEWTKVASAKTYDIEYTTKKSYFNGSDQTSTVTGIESTHYEKTGLDAGNQYFFRVRAVNDKGESGWSKIWSIKIGEAPAAPTTWSSTTTAITGEPLVLYWVHNSEDGSSQTYAELEMTINGTKETQTIKNTEDEDEKDKTSSYKIDTSKYTEGTTILWRVRTAGIMKEYGDWSVQRTVEINAPATLSLKLVDSDNNPIETLTQFPFYVSALAGPSTQSAVSYHVGVTSNEIYRTVDQIGNAKIVNAGEEVYSQYFDTSEALLLELSAHNIDLENGITYTVTCTVAMNTGLTATATVELNVDWTDKIYEPDVEIGVDEDTWSVYLRPYCLDSENNIVEDVLLSIYRREFDGSFTEISTELENGSNIHITDPHPALDYARYRVVAISKTTGNVSYYDPPGYPIQCKSVILQWNASWSSFESTTEDILAEPTMAGSMLELPYNIDISEESDIDVSLVEYTGRANPVSYYGTQLGVSGTWNMDIPRDDEETIYQLRRLQVWLGDVYVRSPSGIGYWANIQVSMDDKHQAVIIPVTLTVTRVEGGL